MRIVLLLAAAVLAACSSSPSAAPSSTPEVPPSTSSSSPTTSSSAAPAVLTWGGSGSSSGVDITVAAPTASPEPAPEPGLRFVLVSITAANKSAGTATIAVWARAGQQELDVYDGPDGAGKFLPGESGTVQRQVAVPVDAKELTLEVYANVDQEPTQNRLAFKGPLS